MSFPDFFAAVPPIVLHDPLAEFLGAAEGGILEYRYHHAVLLAGHSCPTVAAAWNMSRRALAALYPVGLPERGGIRVEFREAMDAGVTGVMASVATLLTGAAGQGGFKGLAGRFGRRQLLGFGAGLEAEIRYTRLDTGVAVEVAADLRRVPADPDLGALLQVCLGGGASARQEAAFRSLWQERVRSVLLDFGDDPAVFPVRELGGDGGGEAV